MLRSLAVTASLFVALSAAAQQPDAYPSRPVRMIVPNAPGGSSDFVARILQPKMSEVMGVQVVIDNRGGASGNIGVEVAGRAAPDGYTLLLGNVNPFAKEKNIRAGTVFIFGIAKGGMLVAIYELI